MKTQVHLVYCCSMTCRREVMTGVCERLYHLGAKLQVSESVIEYPGETYIFHVVDRGTRLFPSGEHITDLTLCRHHTKDYVNGGV